MKHHCVETLQGTPIMSCNSFSSKEHTFLQCLLTVLMLTLVRITLSVSRMYNVTVSYFLKPVLNIIKVMFFGRLEKKHPCPLQIE